MRPTELELFRAVPAAVLAAYSVTRRYGAGEVVFSQGDPTTGLWVVLEGRIAMERVGPDGVVYTTGVQLPGEMIGMAGLWDRSGYPASARALEGPTVLLWMSREGFFDLHRAYPDFGLAVSRSLAGRLRYVLETTADTRGRPVPRQLAVFLSTLYRRSGSDIALTHEDLAHMIGARRETVSRVLRDFAQRGWIEVKYGHIRVRDAAPLEAAGDPMDDNR